MLNANFSISHQWSDKFFGQQTVSTKTLQTNRNVTKELKQTGIDRMPISLNAPDRETYTWICKPTFSLAAYSAVIQFIKDCKSEDLETEITIVAILQLDIAACEKLRRYWESLLE